jgi:hypothetical protein
MGPSWQCAKESQDQDHDQYSSKHVLLLFPSLRGSNYRAASSAATILEDAHRKQQRGSASVVYSYSDGLLLVKTALM